MNDISHVSMVNSLIVRYDDLLSLSNNGGDQKIIV